MSSQARISFAKSEPLLEPPFMTKIAHDSFGEFAKGVVPAILGVGPIEQSNPNRRVEFKGAVVAEPSESEDECLENGLTFSRHIYVDAELYDSSGTRVEEGGFDAGAIPWMTDRGTFIVKGLERVLESRLVDSPGVRVGAMKNGNIVCLIQPASGPCVEFLTGVCGDRDVMKVRVGRKGELQPATMLFRALGLTDSAMEGLFEDLPLMLNTLKHLDRLKKARTDVELRERSLKKLYKEFTKKGRQTPLKGIDVLVAQKWLTLALFDPAGSFDLSRAGRDSLNARFGGKSECGVDAITKRAVDVLGPDNEIARWTKDASGMALTLDDLLSAVFYLEAVFQGRSGFYMDDFSSLVMYIVDTPEVLLARSLSEGIEKGSRQVVKKLAGKKKEQWSLDKLMKPFRNKVSNTMEAFLKQSPLSQPAETTNPLSLITQIRRVTKLGKVGLDSHSFTPAGHDLHYDHYGRLCPHETPEDSNVGLTLSPAIYASLDSYRRLVTPLRKLDGSQEIVPISAAEEFASHVKPFPQAGRQSFARPTGPEGKLPGFLAGSSSEFEYEEISPIQGLSPSAALIPFLEHNDARRALMGANMQRQAVPLLFPERPIVGTGIERLVADENPYAVRSRVSGTVTRVTASSVTVAPHDGEGDVSHALPQLNDVRVGVCGAHIPSVRVGDEVEQGAILADAPACAEGELALGRNLTVAYMMFDGFGYEDGIIISERVANDDLLTSLNVLEEDVYVTSDELLTRDWPGMKSGQNANLDENGIVKVGSRVREGDVIVGAKAEKHYSEYGEVELASLFYADTVAYRDTSRRAGLGRGGTVLSVKRLGPDDVGLKRGVKELVRVRIAQRRAIEVGDKLAGRHGNKGVVCRILPVADMPYLADGTPVDAILNPLGVPSRMNLGQLLECHLGWAASHGGIEGNEGHDAFVSCPPFDGASYEEVRDALKRTEGFFKEDVRARFGDAALDHPSLIPVFDGDGKTDLFDGRTGEAFNQPVVVGTAYLMKLNHMVVDAIHVRSTGPHAAVTQQPTKGRRHQGGQRIGEMESWALEAYGAARVLEEAFTTKSDDICRRGEVPDLIRESRTTSLAPNPEGTVLLENELLALGLRVDRDDESNTVALRMVRPGEVERLSSGEVTAPKDINRYLKPVKNGLFEPSIFEASDEEHGDSSKRGIRPERRNIGHIKLAAPVCNILFTSRKTRVISRALGLKPSELEKVVYYSHYLILGVDKDRYERDWEEGKVQGLFEQYLEGYIEEWEHGLDEGDPFYVDDETPQDPDGLERYKSEQRPLIESERREAYNKSRKTFENKVKPGAIVPRDEGYGDLKTFFGDYFEAQIGAEAVRNALGNHDILSHVVAKANSESIESVRFEDVEQHFIDAYDAEQGTPYESLNDRRRSSAHAKFEKAFKQARKVARDKSVGSIVTRSEREKLSKGFLMDGFFELEPLWELLGRQGVDLADAVIDCVAVMPTALRPWTELEGSDANSGGGIFAGDLNELYEAVIKKNNRLKELENEAYSILESNLLDARRELQEAVDTLLDNGAHGNPVKKKKTGRELESISRRYEGRKDGRFRSTLLGKRNDYTGRSVIVADPSLRLGECGLPFALACELFKPFLEEGLLADAADPSRVFSALKKVMDGRVVLLNRTPTLHRLNIVAFRPVLRFDRAIHLHPLCCKEFGADFDGDEMAVHLPLSRRAQAEARELMSVSANLRTPATGKSLLAPRQDILAGLYLITRDSGVATPDAGKSAHPQRFLCFGDVVDAFERGALRDTTERIEVTLTEDLEVIAVGNSDIPSAEGAEAHNRMIANQVNQGRSLETTVGRVLFNQCLPRWFKFSANAGRETPKGYVNCEVSQDAVSRVVDKLIDVQRREGHPASDVLDALDALKRVGLSAATSSGLTISAFDYNVPDDKSDVVGEKGFAKIASLVSEADPESMVQDRELRERYRAIWDEVCDSVNDAFRASLAKNPANPLGILARSGARGNDHQLCQGGGMRGFMDSLSHPEVLYPIVSSLAEGMSPTEFFVSGFGSRKVVADTSLSTESVGELTRTLVSVADFVMTDKEEDCGSREGVYLPLFDSGRLNPDTLGRYFVEPLRFDDGRVYECAEPWMADSPDAMRKLLESCSVARIDELGAEALCLHVRSTLTCHLESRVCRKCYGWDLSKGELVDQNVAVGVIAAQSIGEPGTQMTFDTRHTGGSSGSGGIKETVKAIRKLFTLNLAHPAEKTVASAAAAAALVKRIFAENGADVDLRHIELVMRALMASGLPGVVNLKRAAEYSRSWISSAAFADGVGQLVLRASGLGPESASRIDDMGSPRANLVIHGRLA